MQFSTEAYVHAKTHRPEFGVVIAGHEPVTPHIRNARSNTNTNTTLPEDS